MLAVACGEHDAARESSSSSSTAHSAESSTSSASSGTGGAGATTSNASTAGVGGATTTSAATASSASSGGYVPDPIPNIDPEPPADCGLEKPFYYQFLDDQCHLKTWPSFQDRDAPCPIVDDSAIVPITGGGSVAYHPSSDPVVFDSSALADVVPSDLRVAVILIRRVNGVPHYHYISNGTEEDVFQPWSTTKVFAAANAAATLEIESNYKVGLTAHVDGTPLGDFVSSMVSYDDNPYTSNSLGAYFHNIGGRTKANGLIHADWLNRPQSESFGGNYGDQAAPLGYTFIEPGGPSWTTQSKPTPNPAISNALSAHTMAEFLKRLVLHREEPQQRLPGIQWKDIRTLLYGANPSAAYGPWGGMTRDTAIYLQTSHDLDYIESRSHGRWSIFSKLGFGSGTFVNVGYACFPVLDPQDQPVPGWGREFVIAARLESGGANEAERDRILAKAYRSIVTRIVDGRL